MQLITHNHPHACESETQPHEKSGETYGEVEFICGYKMPVVAGTMSPKGQHKLEKWRTRETPRCLGRVNDIEVLALRDTGSATCVVKTYLVKPEQMTGSHELCMLIDGVVKRFPTAIVHIDAPFIYFEIQHATIQHQNYKVHNTVYAYMDTKGRASRHLHSTRKKK